MIFGVAVGAAPELSRQVAERNPTRKMRRRGEVRMGFCAAKFIWHPLFRNLPAPCSVRHDPPRELPLAEIVKNSVRKIKLCLHCADTGCVHHITLPGRRQVGAFPADRGHAARFVRRATSPRFDLEPSSAVADGASNPILPAPAQDPHVTLHRGLYYYCESAATGIYLRVAQDFLALGQAPRVLVWAPPKKGPASQNVWAPELHILNGRAYIYFAADDGNNARHRMWVLTAETENLLGRYRLAASLDTGGWAIDGTVFSDDRGALYCVWSGWPGRVDGQQNLYISRMADPLTLIGPRVLIAKPDQSWERKGMPICEGPQVLRREGRTFIVYSASASWTADYCLGMLVSEGRDLLNPQSWKKAGQVFGRNEHAWGVGHCGFLETPQGEHWIFYHAKTLRRPGWGDREVRAQPFAWSTVGWPILGEPAARSLPLRRRLATVSPLRSTSVSPGAERKSA